MKQFIVRVFLLLLIAAFVLYAIFVIPLYASNPIVNVVCEQTT